MSLIKKLSKMNNPVFEVKPKKDGGKSFFYRALSLKQLASMYSLHNQMDRIVLREDLRDSDDKKIYDITGAEPLSAFSI